LYITANVYRKPSDAYLCTTAMRFSLDEVLVSINAEYFSSDDTLFNFSPAHGGTDAFYFATHDDADTLLVYDWPESVGSGLFCKRTDDEGPFYHALVFRQLRKVNEGWRNLKIVPAQVGHHDSRSTWYPPAVKRSK
jgi:hypothetical protein